MSETHLRQEREIQLDFLLNIFTPFYMELDKLWVYTKPSFHDNLFDGVDVDKEEFEVSIKCPKKNRTITKQNNDLLI